MKRTDSGFATICYVDVGPRPSRRGISCAAELARIHGARLTVLPTLETSRLRHSRSTRERLAGEYSESLDAALEGLRGSSVELRVEELANGGSDAVLASLRRIAPDMIVKVGRWGTGPEMPWAGNLARELVRWAPCPVWILHPAQTGGTDTVVAAVDVSEGRSPELTREVLDVARSIAASVDAELRILHVWSMVGEARLTHPLTPVRADRLRSIRSDLRDRRRRKLEELLGDHLDAEGVSLELLRGSAVPVIQKVVRRMEADLLVVGHSGRSGLTRFIPGNLSERILGTTGSSLLVVPSPERESSAMPETESTERRGATRGEA